MRGDVRGTMVRLVAVGVVMLVACGPRTTSRATPVTGPDGTKNWAVIECQRRATCLELAGETCPHAYKIHEEHAPESKQDRISLLVHCVPAGKPES